MKLELKHLVPYLPYGLQMANGKFVGGIITMNPHSASFKITCSDWWENISDEKYKPILRPMSDLESPADGYSVILEKMVREAENHCDVYDEWMDSYFENKGNRILQAPFEIIDELFKQHYDVFGLIPAGLAIDINTITK